MKMKTLLKTISVMLVLATSVAAAVDPAAPRDGGTLAVRGALLHTGSGDPIVDGGVLVEDGRITQVGRASWRERV